jgi:hypothetical protein
MKNQLKKLVLVVASLGFVLSSCEKDLYEDAVIQKNQNFKIEKKSFKEMSIIPDFKQPLDKVLRTTTFNNVANKTVLEELYNFTIMEENPVRILTIGNKTSYILCIKRSVKEQLVFENLILEQGSDGLKAFIAKYTLNEKPVKSLVDDSFVANFNKTELNELNIGSQNANHPPCTNCPYHTYTVLVAMCDNDGGGHTGEAHLADNNCYNPNFLYTVSYTGVSIVGTVPTNSGEAAGNNMGSTGTSSQGGDSGGDSGFNSGTISNPPVVTTPAIPLSYTFSDVFQALGTEAQENVIHYITNNPSQENSIRLGLDTLNLMSLSSMNLDVQSGVTAYLASNGFSTSSYTIANQFITQSLANPSIKLNLYLSKNSPYNVDRSAITDDTTEGAKFNQVYEELAKIPQFKALFTSIFNVPQTKFKVRFEVGNIPNDNGEFVNAYTQEETTNNFLIKINSQILDNGGDHPATLMEIAKTILHESIHAYLMVKALHPNVGMPIPNAGSMNIQQLINAVYPAVGTVQHNFMIQHMFPTMQSILTPLVNQLTTAPTRAICESLQIGINNQWSWTEYINYLCYQGLEATTKFQNIFAPVYNSQNQIVSGNTNYDFYSDYITMGHDILDRIFP